MYPTLIILLQQGAESSHILREFRSPYEGACGERKIYAVILKKGRAIYSNMDYNLRLLCDSGRNYSVEDDGSEYVDYPVLKELEQEPWYQKLGENTSSIKYIPAYVSSEFQKTEDNSAMRAVRLLKNLNSGRVLGIMEVNIPRKQVEDIFPGAVWKKRASRCF